MRKINTVLAVLLLVIFVLHGTMGGWMLWGVGTGAGKMLAWAGVILLSAHAVLGLYFTACTLRTSGFSYLKENFLFWLRRGSGFLILPFLFLHIGLFGGMEGKNYILYPFTAGRLLVQLGLTFTVFLHIFLNLRPLLLSLGIFRFRQRREDLFISGAVLLIFMALAAGVYYLGWQTI